MFFKEVTQTDLGDTTIPNIFIDIFMPMADGLFVKVYLFGYKYACDTVSNPKCNNSYLAKNLNVPLSDVVNAWKFWENKGLVKIHKNDSTDEFEFSIEFLDLKKLYSENILTNTPSIKSNSDSIVSVAENPSIRLMFNSINKIVGRPLDPSEKISILDVINKYNMSPDMIVFAYENVKERLGTSKPVRYIESMLRNWYDSDLYTPEDVRASLAIKSERYNIYKTIFNSLGFSRQPSKSEKDIMDSWIDDLNMDIEILLEACSKSKNIANPSISYINGIVKKWHSKSVRSLEDIKILDEKKVSTTQNSNYSGYSNNNNNKTYKKTKFHNFDETFTQYSAEELDEIIERSQREKFK